MKYDFKSHIRVFYDIRESYAPISAWEREKQEMELRAKNFVQELVIELIQEKDKNKWREIFKSHEQWLKNSPRTKYKWSRFEVYMDTLSQHLFWFTWNLKSNPEEGLNRFIKSFNLDINVISEKKNDSREFTKEEEKIVREFSWAYLKELIHRWVALTVFGKINAKAITWLRDELVSRYPWLPRKELDTFISNLEISIRNDEETFAWTSMKAKAYEWLNWAMKNIPWAKDIQDWVSGYLKKNGYSDRMPSNNEKLIIVENIYNGLPSITKKALELVWRESVASNLIRAFIDMFYDAKRVTIAGGEFRNTAENAIVEMTNKISTKRKWEVTTTGVTKSETKSEDLSDIFKDWVASVNRKKFQSIMQTIGDPIWHLKKTIWPEKYREFCLYAQSMEYKTALFKDMDTIFTNQVKKDAEQFELAYRGTIGKIQLLPKWLTIDTLSDTLRKVPKDIIEEYLMNPNIALLGKIIRLSGVSENQVNKLLIELKRTIDISLEMNKKWIANTKENILETIIRVGSKDIKLKNIATQREAQEILSTQKNLTPEVQEYLMKVIRQVVLQKSSTYTGFSAEKDIWKILHRDNAGTATPEEKKYLNSFEEQGTSVKNIAWIKANNEILTITNKLPGSIDINDPWQVEEALKNKSLTPDQIKAIQLIQQNHQSISQQIEIFRDRYGEDSTKVLLKSALLEDRETSEAEKIMNKYAYLEQNIYEKSIPQNMGVDNQIANMTRTSDDIFVRTVDIWWENTLSYRVWISDNPYTRDIKNEEGEVILKDVPFYWVSSTIKELGLIAWLWIENIWEYLPILNKSIRQRIGENVDPMDKTFSQREWASVISILIKLFKFNPPPSEIANNAIELRNYFLQQRNNLPHSLKYQWILTWLYDTDGNTSKTRFEKNLESVAV